jgi:hypothetical protein
MKPTLAASLILSSLLFIFVQACDNAESVQADSAQPKALQGTWKEVLPWNMQWFAGGSLVITIGPDSVVIREKRFTDVSGCNDTEDTRLCSDVTWENSYRGTWSADDSLLSVTFGFTGTTANRLTPDLRMQDGSYGMRYALRGPGVLDLHGRSGTEALPGRDSLDLNRE